MQRLQVRESANHYQQRYDDTQRRNRFLASSLVVIAFCMKDIVALRFAALRWQAMLHPSSTELG
jgi:hypothetical protein